MEKQTLIDEIDILLDVYAYHIIHKLISSSTTFSQDVLYLVEMLKERRELNVTFLSEHKEDNKRLEEKYDFDLCVNQTLEEEQIANYIMDLEAKIRTGQTIDFVRSVSPILYRLFMRLAKTQIPNLNYFIEDNKNDQYDTWLFHKMKDNQNRIFQHFLSEKRDRNVTTSSLLDLIEGLEFSKEIMDLVKDLRGFEKSVRNPLAHLIKPFDEEELYRTTHFSSQLFLEKIIKLALYTGVRYQSQPFYFDEVNEILKKELKKD
ncbi:hypothetical protein HMPREF9318_00579 [Streptococcus urinalis FB127-CNA-2]|uniref:CRISPR-associated protein Csm6 n=1 Tax=Streptococcus urinalis 2285-97 TaxID=764291 RepID=G5KGL3_9STRE|nr:hypothetical protein [Streptococcus urinalis]EHJ56724.1 CRISPR-associated protein Csm6 [Streptococcus urinalis 2285-97]EKS22381.1 hypothetical protein HMPREF9318_00579 [Streptococcus urinalis FB127-CNA-2]VEF32194.1 attenuator of transcription, LytR family regulator [Streptococcus urinalis]